MTIKLTNSKKENINFMIDINTLKQINVITCLVIIISVANANAKDFGVQGNVFKVLEQGFVSDMESRIKEIDIEKEREKMLFKAKQTTNEPKALSLVKATENREFHFDPTYTLPKDIVLPCGKLLHKAGTKVNPLDYMNLERKMIFIDGRDNEQVEWLKEELIRYKGKTALNSEIENKVILTGGKIFELEKRLDLSLYFDQAGELTSKFGIHAVPATIEQDGKLLKIIEVALNENEHHVSDNDR